MDWCWLVLVGCLAGHGHVLVSVGWRWLGTWWGMDWCWLVLVGAGWVLGGAWTCVGWCWLVLVA